MMPAVRAYMVLARARRPRRAARAPRPTADEVDGVRRPRRRGLDRHRHEHADRALHGGVAAVPDVGRRVRRAARARPRDAAPRAEPSPPRGGPRRRAAPRTARARPRRDRPRRRRAARPADAPDGRAGRPPHRASSRWPRRPTSPGLPEAMQDLTRSSQALQAMVMQVRMIPVEAVFMRFPRLVRDLSAKLGKQVELVLIGTRHRARPHGRRRARRPARPPRPQLARPRASRRRRSALAAGKPATGTLEIAARHAGGNVVITVRDDGRGIDPARVAAQGRRARA